MTDVLAKIESTELKEIDASKADMIRQTFVPMAEMLDRFEESYNDLIARSKEGITDELAAEAKRMRIDIGKVRIETEKVRKAQKAEYLLAGKAIDGFGNILKWAVSGKEDSLKEIEKHRENEEKKRLEKLQLDRADQLSEYLEDAHERKLSEMDEDVWAAYFGAKKKEYEDRIEAEKQAELARIEREKAEAAERLRIKEENEKLRKEAEERERLAKVEAEKRAKEDAARKKKEAEEKAKREEQERKQREEYEAKLQSEREERERLAKIERDKLAEIERKELEERAKREKLEAEIKAKADAEEAERKEAAKRARSKKIQRDNRNEMTLALSEIMSLGPYGDDIEMVIDAIIAGKIPHVKYEG